MTADFKGDFDSIFQRSIADHPTITEHLRQAEARQPVVAPLSPGERPTEPGIYIVKDNEGFRAVEMRAPSEFDGTDQYGDPEVLATPGSDVLDSVGEFQRWGFTFIARIYPDRIEGREG